MPTFASSSEMRELLNAVARAGRSDAVALRPEWTVQRATLRDLTSAADHQTPTPTLRCSFAVTGDRALSSLDPGRGFLVDPPPVGAAALLAWQDGPYAHPDAKTLFDGKRIAQAMWPLPPPLRVADEVGRTFTGTVAELADVVAAVLTEPAT